MAARNHERGIALVIVLWVGLLIVAIAGAFIVDTRTSTQLTRNFLDNTEARALADGGIHLAVFELLRNDAEAQWRRDGRRYRRTVPGGALEISIEDEAGKIDLNNASVDLLEGLFRSAGVDDDRARAIVQAIDNIRSGEESPERLLRSAGVPDGDIKPVIDALKKSTGRNSTIGGNRNATNDAANLAFHSVDSLGQVPGITADLHALLRPALTVFGDGGLHYLTSPREALLAVPGITVEAVDNFLFGRAGDEANNPLDDFLFQGQARDYWREDESSFVTVKVMAEANNGAKFVRIALVEIAEQDNQPFTVWEWREGDALSMPPPRPTPSETAGEAGGAT